MPYLCWVPTDFFCSDLSLGFRRSALLSPPFALGLSRLLIVLCLCTDLVHLEPFSFSVIWSVWRSFDSLRILFLRILCLGYIIQYLHFVFSLLTHFYLCWISY